MLPLTVFTPTYNRAHTLERVFNSLCRQPPELFEWLVVDDGSTDNTADLLAELQATAPFPMRMIHQPNGGKHRAHNAAVNAAQGELTIVLDSDDEFVPGVLKTIWDEWLSIPGDVRNGYAGILGNCVDASGQLHGMPFPESPVDGHMFELDASGAMVGEKPPCYRTDILRCFPMDERAGCKAYVPEGIVWIKIGMRYKVRCINEPVRIYHKDLTDKHSIMNIHDVPKIGAWGKMLYCATALNMSSEYWPRFFWIFIKRGSALSRYGFHSGYSLRQQIRLLTGAIPKLIWFSGLFVGTAYWMLDRIKSYE